MTGLDETHDPARKSWIGAANDPTTDFPIQNLPLGVFRRPADPRRRIGMAIGDQVLDLAGTAEAGLLPADIAEVCREPALNRLMALGGGAASSLRHMVSAMLRADESGLNQRKGRIAPHLAPMNAIALELPAAIANFSDFFASIFHATNTGSMFRPDNPLLPNYKYVPIAYHGRASSVVTSRTPVRRPNGQTRGPQVESPRFGPSRNLDYEVEIGFFVGPGNELGAPISIANAGKHIFGFCLLNDWSARDIQAWEYQPLGPFLAKSFATTISPWVVTAEALIPFRVPAFERPAGDPAPLDYLWSPEDAAAGGIDLTIEVLILSAMMREQGIAPHRLSRSNSRDVYWTVAQMLAHHTSNGCNLLPGDLIGSGTISGCDNDSFGSLLELTWRGTKPIQLPSGETRRFLEDGDALIMRGRCAREGFAPIGFGDCVGTVVPALEA